MLDNNFANEQPELFKNETSKNGFRIRRIAAEKAKAQAWTKKG